MLLIGLINTVHAQCVQAKPYHYPFQNPKLSISKRVNDLVSRLTLREEVYQMRTDAFPIPRLGIPAYHWWNECLHGDMATPATVFPEPIGLAATWDTPLHHKVAVAISDEDCARYNNTLRLGAPQSFKGISFFAPNINIFRDPRWGRGMETYGEDPYLTSRFAVAFITGLQGNDPHYLKVVATPKHFAVHSGPELLRHGFNAVVSDYDLFDTYLPAFAASIRLGHAESIMGAYSALDGLPCTANPRLLGNILRDRWGFRGYVVSDCGAIGDIFFHHNMARSIMQASAMAVRSGCDMTCGFEYDNLLRAVQQGFLTKAEVDRAVKRILTARFRLGMFDPPSMVPYRQIPPSVIDSESHRNLALQVARESIVLLKNQNGILPITSHVRSIAVIGPNAASVPVLLGNYNGHSSHSVTVLEGLRKRTAGHIRIDYARGCGVVYPDGISKRTPTGNPNSVPQAVATARRCDLVLFVGGYSPGLEGEEGTGSTSDRLNIGLPGVQERLVEALVATGKPVVVVLLNGGPLTVNWCVAHVPAIVEAWYPGEEGGTAIANVLFGDYNPAGRLPVTVYQSLDQLPAFTDYSMKARTYRYFGGDPLYPFGYGLSYTRFSYSRLAMPGHIRQKQPVRVSVQVANMGHRDGDEVVEVYLRPDPEGRLGRLIAPGQPMPRLELAGFTRVHLAAGARKTVSFTIQSQQLLLVNMQGDRKLQPGAWQVFVGGRPPDLNHPERTKGVVLSKLIVL